MNKLLKLSFFLLLFTTLSFGFDNEESWIKSCDNKNGNSCYKIGLIHENNNDISNAFDYYNKAADVWEEKCDKTNDSFYCYSYDYIIKKKFKNGFSLFEKSCENKDYNACAILGVVYYVGKDGIEINKEKSFKLWENSCENNNSKSCYILGSLYDKGDKEFIKSDYKKSFYFLNKACKLGEDEACVVHNKLKILKMIFDTGQLKDK